MSDDTIPASWTPVEIEDVLFPYPNGKKIRQGWSPQCENHPAESHDDWAVLRTSAIQDGSFVDAENKKLPPGLEPRTQLEVVVGDILMTCAGPRARCGVTCLVRSTRPRLLISGKMYQLRADAEIVERHFLELFLRESGTKKKIDEMKTGISDSGLNLTHDRFRTLTIPLPPLSEQKRIVAKIEELFSELEAGEASLRKARRQLGVYRQSLLKQAFEGKLTQKWRTPNPKKTESPATLLARIQTTQQASYERDLNEWNACGRLGRKPSTPSPISPLTEDESVFSGELPMTWRAVPAEAIGDVQLGRQRSPKNQSKDYPTPYIRAANITESGLALDDILEMEFTPQERRTFTLRAGDIILSEASGSASQVGKPAMWRGEIPGCCFQNTVIRHRLFDPEQSEFYLWLYRFFYLHGIFSQTAGGVGINHLSAGKFSRLPVPLCSLPEQQEIVRLLGEQFEAIERNERELDAALKRSEALRQSILKKAFTGRLVPQDPADEPASALLARLRAERGTTAVSKMKKDRKSAVLKL